MKRIVSTLALLAAMLAASAALAAPAVYRSTLSGPAEDPPNASPGAGIAAIVIDDVAMTMRLTMPFFDMLSPSTAAHLHCCTPVPLMGTAPVAIPFTDFPVGTQSGFYSRVFDLSDAATYAPAFIGAHGGTVAAARSFLLAGIGANESYLNVHSAPYPAGEIRGFLVLWAQPVPEPAAWLMMGVGLAGLAGLAQRRRRPRG